MTGIWRHMTSFNSKNISIPKKRNFCWWHLHRSNHVKSSLPFIIMVYPRGKSKNQFLKLLSHVHIIIQRSHSVQSKLEIWIISRIPVFFTRNFGKKNQFWTSVKKPPSHFGQVSKRPPSHFGQIVLNMSIMTRPYSFWPSLSWCFD